jgi:hypothetical protein
MISSTEQEIACFSARWPSATGSCRRGICGNRQGARRSPRRIEARIEAREAAKARAFWRAYRDNFITEADIARIAELGFNSVRVAMNARLLLPEGQDAFDEAEFQYVTNLVEWCRIHGIYAILDMHAAPGGERERTSTIARTFPELYTVASNQDRLVRIWTELARRYAQLRPSSAMTSERAAPGRFLVAQRQALASTSAWARRFGAVDKNHTHRRRGQLGERLECPPCTLRREHGLQLS